MAAKKTTAKAESQEKKDSETQATQDGKSAETNTPETQSQEPGKDTPDQGQNQDAPPADTDENSPPQTPPAQEGDGKAPHDDDEKLFSLDEMAAQFRVPGWQHAALTRYQGWETGKEVTKAEYAQALKNIHNRPQGGGRVS